MTVISQRTVKTKKDHYCHGCGNIIPKGFEVETSVSVDDGRISTAYWCDTCCTVIDKLESWQKEDGFAFGELKEYWPEYMKQESK